MITNWQSLVDISKMMCMYKLDYFNIFINNQTFIMTWYIVYMKWTLLGQHIYHIAIPHNLSSHSLDLIKPLRGQILSLPPIRAFWDKHSQPLGACPMWWLGDQVKAMRYSLMGRKGTGGPLLRMGPCKVKWYLVEWTIHVWFIGTEGALPLNETGMWDRVRVVVVGIRVGDQSWGKLG